MVSVATVAETPAGQPRRGRPSEEAAVWADLRRDAETAAAAEPMLASFLHASVLNHSSLGDALAYVIGTKLEGAGMNALQLHEIARAALGADPEIIAAVAADIRAVHARDAACRTNLQPFLYFKGFLALQSHRVAHWLWRQGRDTLAFHMQSKVSDRFAVDIHPAALIGRGVMIDHATSVVIGETAVVGDDCSLLHEVTLGGTGVKGGDRHPKLGRGVLIGAGAKVLGNIAIGDEARIAAGSVVLDPVAPKCTVAGVPARPVGGPCARPAASMDHRLEAPDA